MHIVDKTKFITHNGGSLILRDKVPDLELTKLITVGDNVYIRARCFNYTLCQYGSNVVIGAVLL